MGINIYDRKFRNTLYQILVVLLVLLALGFLGQTTAYNLQQRGISSGFDFLNEPAGFEISMHLIDYDDSSTYGRALLVSILNTLVVSVLGIFIASLLGLFMGIARLSRNYLLSKFAAIYVETLRNVPLLLQMFFWYFAVFQALPHPRQSLSLGDSVFLNVRGLYFPSMSPTDTFVYWPLALFGCVAAIVVYNYYRRNTDVEGMVRSPTWFFSAMLGLIVLLVLMSLDSPVSLIKPELKGFNFSGGMQLIPEFSALVFSLGTYTAAFIAEIVRAGIESIPKGQIEASHSLGLSRAQTLRFVILPQASRVIVPPLTSQYLNLAKNSSLASAIAFPDLVLIFAGTTLNQTGQAIEVVALTMLFYLVLSLGISGLMNWYNQSQALKGAR